MIVLGAGGFAAQLLDDLDAIGLLDEDAAFYDDVAPPEDRQFSGFPVLSDLSEVRRWFSVHGEQFLLGLSVPATRKKYREQWSDAGGVLSGLQSPRARVSRFSSEVGPGVIILAGTIVEPFVSLSEGTNINLGCAVCHDCRVGEYCEIGPGVTLCGRVRVGDHSVVGAGATVLPRVEIGQGCVVGAGAVVINDVADGEVVVGVPARPRKQHP